MQRYKFIVMNVTENTIINTTSVRTNSSVHFSTRIGIPPLYQSPNSFYAGPGSPDYWNPPVPALNTIQVVTYFEGNENILPTHEMITVPIQNTFCGEDLSGFFC